MEGYLAAVRKYAYAIEKINLETLTKMQRYELYLAAQQNPFIVTNLNRSYISDQQYEDICLAAVKLNNEVLECIDRQTSAVCLAAVQSNGMLLRFIKKQTPEICLAAVMQHGCAIIYVHQQTADICLAALLSDCITNEYEFESIIKMIRPAYRDICVEMHNRRFACTKKAN